MTRLAVLVAMMAVAVPRRAAGADLALSGLLSIARTRGQEVIGLYAVNSVGGSEGFFTGERVTADGRRRSSLTAMD
jgi:hypothetical protein